LFGVISLLQLGSGWPCEGRGQPCPSVVNNTALDVPGSMTRSSGECSACPLLLEVLSELHKLPCFFVELGLHLAELLKLRALTPPTGARASASSRGISTRDAGAAASFFLACRGGFLRRDPPDRCGSTRELGRNPRRQGCGHRQSRQRGSGHMRT
jgi:hypothetical protein